MKTKELIDFFENFDFIVHLHKQDGVQCAEIEKWTNGGVDMIIRLNPFTAKEFRSYVEDFNIDDTIDLHRQDQRYRNNFTISESLEDFTIFYNHLEEIVEELESH